MSAHSSEREISDSEGDASKVGDTKNGSTVSFLTSTETEIATYVWEPKLRGFLAEDAMRDLFHEQKSLVTWQQRITKSSNEGSESRNNNRYAVVVQDLATRWIQSYPCKKNRRRRRRVYESFWSRHISQKVICTEKFMRIWQILWRVDMESSNIHSSSLRNKRNCRTSYTTSKRGNISCTIAIRTGW